MTVLDSRSGTMYRLVRRVALLGFLIGVVLTVAFVVVTTSRVTALDPPASCTTDLFGMPMVTVARAMTADGRSSASMSLNWGTIVAIAGGATFGAGVGYFYGVRSRRRGN